MDYYSTLYGIPGTLVLAREGKILTWYDTGAQMTAQVHNPALHMVKVAHSGRSVECLETVQIEVGTYLDFLIPPMTILTAVENSAKHFQSGRQRSDAGRW